MSSTFKTIIGLCFALSLFGNACSNQTSEAREGDDENTQVTQSEDSHAGHNHAAGEGHGGSADNAEAAQAYETVIREIKSAQQTIRDQKQLVMEVEKLFRDFIAEYPGSEEAADAQLNLGQMYSQLGRSEDAIAVLYELLDGGTASNEKMGIAHFILGDAYKNSDQHDKAKREYRIVVEQYAFLGSRIIDMARSNLGDIDTLKMLSVGSKPIPFEVKGTNGQTLSIDKFKGKVVLLDFWATWCGPCRVEMPNVVNLYKKNHKKGFEIIGISLDKSRSSFDQYIAANDMDWPHFFDGKYWQNEVAMKYRVRAIPATFLIDRQGVIRYRSLRGRQLEEAIDLLLKETS